MRRVVVIFCVLGFSLASATGAAARCPGKGSVLPGKDTAVVIKRTADAVVVKGKKKMRIYACATRYGKLRRIDGSGQGHYQILLAGKFAALVADEASGDTDGTGLYIFSLGSRKTVQLHWSFPQPSAVVLSKAGSAAWILKDYTYADGFKEHTGTSVFSQGANWKEKPRMLDDATGATIATDKLRLDDAGTTVFWFRNGAETSAPVTGGQVTNVFGGGCFIEGVGSKPGRSC